MTPDLFYAMLSVVLRGGLSLVVLATLMISLPHEFIKAERWGLGIMAGGSFMTLPILYTHAPSPFDGWAATVLSAGALLFVSGRAYRALRHWWANRAQIAVGQAYRKTKGAKP